MRNSTENYHVTTITSTKCSTTMPSHALQSTLRVLPAFFATAFFITSFRLACHLLLPAPLLDSSTTLSEYSRNTFQNGTLNHAFINFKKPPLEVTKWSQTNKPKFIQECIEVQPVDAVYRLDNLTHKQVPPFNTRSYCITSSICVSPRTEKKPGIIYEDGSVSTTCRKSTPSLIDAYVNPRDISMNCTSLKKSVFCMHGIQDNNKDSIMCPRVLSLSTAPVDATMLSSDMVVIVPAFQHLGNIYHFAHVVGSVTHIISSLRPLIEHYRTSMAVADTVPSIPRSLTVLFRGDMPAAYGHWQDSLIQAVIQTRLIGLGFHVDIISYYEDQYNLSPSSRSPPFRQIPTLCSHSAIFIGPRDTREWPFASYKSYKHYSGNRKHSSISTSVPVEAVLFKAAIYHAYNLSTILHTSSLLRSDITTVPKHLLLDLPPLSIGYARRNRDVNMDHSTVSGEEIVNGTTRRFSHSDESWFVQMLKSQCRAWGLSFEVLETPKDIPVARQIEMFQRTGFVVGIHGANLVNAIVMHSFGALLELSNHDSQCYFRGAHSGLNYWGFQPSHISTPRESFCSPTQLQCWNNPKYRRIHIENEKDRKRIESLVVEGIERILYINERFKDLEGVPVVLNKTSSEYEIDWST